MAVAVKTSSGARSGRPQGSPAILSLIGLGYLLASLAIIFKLIPWLWWSLFESAGLASSYSVELGTLLVLLCSAAGVGLLVFGGRVLGPNPPAGVRGGVFVGFISLLLVLLLSRWATLWFEYWALDVRWYGPTTGIILSAVLTVLLLLGATRIFLSNRMQRFAVALEGGGWFHATAYKSNQGQKVRRGTIVGILLLIGAGVWTLVSHGTLRRGSADWAINIPFTGTAAIENYGDTQGFVADDRIVPADEKQTVEVRTPGRTSLTAKTNASSARTAS